MPNAIDDLQMLRLIKAFHKVRDADARRRIVSFAEEQVKKRRTRRVTATCSVGGPNAVCGSKREKARRTANQVYIHVTLGIDPLARAVGKRRWI